VTSGGRPVVLVVGCGGSISSVQRGAGAVPQLDAAQLVADVPGLRDVAEIEARSFSLVPSAYETLDDVIRLRRELEGADAAGFVVTHGTDTLEEVAFALDLLWGRDEPVVLTGAMRNASLASPDGPANILASTVTAASPGARGLGVLVVLNDEIHAARSVRKSHTASLAAFASPGAGPLGYVHEGRARIVTRPRRHEPLRVESAADVPVALLTLAIGDDGRLLEHLVPCGYRGVVIEAFGGGHFPAAIAESEVLRTLVESVPVVLSSRTGAGEVLRSTYSGWAGSEMDLLDRGLIASGLLDGPKSRVLLTFLLAGGAGRDEMAQAFARHGLYGEA
jgi:L-asparaginase